MNSQRFIRISRILLPAIACIVLQACATTEYRTHYAMFEAENSAGEWRQFLLYWQTIHTEGWGEKTNRALPVVLETQCSERRLYFYDQSFPRDRQCRNAELGVHFCGDAQLDVNYRGETIAEGQVCASLTDYRGASRILDLSSEINLYVRCRPQVLQKQLLDKKVNTDYLVASEIPYALAIKTVQGGGREVRSFLPELFNHSSVCDPDS